MTTIPSIVGRRRRATRQSLLVAASRGGSNLERVSGEEALRLAHALATTAKDDALLSAYRAEFLKLPNESDIARELGHDVDTDAVRRARETLRATIGTAIRDDLIALYEANQQSGPYSPDADSAGKRALRGAALDLLVGTGDEAEAERTFRHYREATNMTDSISALAILAFLDGRVRDEALADFYPALAGRASRARQMVRGAGASRARGFG